MLLYWSTLCQSGLLLGRTGSLVVAPKWRGGGDIVEDALHFLVLLGSICIVRESEWGDQGGHVIWSSGSGGLRGLGLRSCSGGRQAEVGLGQGGGEGGGG